MGSVGRGKGGGAVGVVKPRAQQTPLATQPTDTGQDTHLRVPKGNRNCLQFHGWFQRMVRSVSYQALSS